MAHHQPTMTRSFSRHGRLVCVHVVKGGGQQLSTSATLARCSSVQATGVWQFPAEFCVGATKRVSALPAPLSPIRSSAWRRGHQAASSVWQRMSSSCRLWSCSPITPRGWQARSQQQCQPPVMCHRHQATTPASAHQLVLPMWCHPATLLVAPRPRHMCRSPSSTWFQLSRCPPTRRHT
jgi:hypothetical protein